VLDEVKATPGTFGGEPLPQGVVLPGPREPSIAAGGDATDRVQLLPHAVKGHRGHGLTVCRALRRVGPAGVSGPTLAGQSPSRCLPPDPAGLGGSPATEAGDRIGPASRSSGGPPFSEGSTTIAISSPPWVATPLTTAWRSMSTAFSRRR